MSDGFRGQTFAWFVVEEGGVGRYRAWASGLPRGRWHSSRRPSQEPDDHEFDGSRSGGPRWLIQNSSAGRAVGGEQGCRPHLLRDEYRCGCGKCGTKRPQVQIQSPRPVPQVSDLRKCRASVACVPLQPPADAPKEQERNTREPRESRGRLRQAEEHPASPHGTADPTAQQGPSGHCDPPSATKRPFGRDVRRPGITADPKSARSSGSGPSPSPHRRRIRSTLAASTRPIECVQMTRGETVGRP